VFRPIFFACCSCRSCVLWQMRFLELRKARIRDMASGKRPRHERVNMEEMVKKAEQNYVDFQEAGPGHVRHCQFIQ